MLTRIGTHCTQHPGQLLHAHRSLTCSCRDGFRSVSCESCTETSRDQRTTSYASFGIISPGGTFLPLSYPQE